MTNRFSHLYCRQRLLGLSDLMQASPSALRRDECSDWRINGKTGHVYADGDGFLACVSRESVRAWTAAKTALSRFHVSQDGDTCGCIQILDPSPGEAAILRQVVGIRKRREYSAEVRAEMVARLVRKPAGGGS